MTNTQVFNLSTVGSYPNEKYWVTPKTFTVGTLPLDFTSIFWSQLDGSGVAIPTGGSLITKEYLKYHKNPISQVLDYSNSKYNKIIYYNNVIYQKQSPKFAVSLTGPLVNDMRFIENVSTITISNASNAFSSLVFDISALRQTYKSPYEFYFFYVQINDITKNSYGYLLYPNKIFLKPKSITNNNGKWQLTTSVNILSSSITHIQSNNIEYDAYLSHKERLKSLPSNITTLPSYLDSNNINFGLSASKTKTYSNTVNPVTSYFSLAPSAVQLYLDPSDTSLCINPDSTYISYSAVFFGDSVTKDIVQIEKISSFVFNFQKFNPSFIVQYDPTVSSIQTFQLLQAPLNNALELSNSTNCVLSASFDLNSGLFNFYNYYTLAGVNFSDKFPLRIDFIADSLNLKNANATAVSTLTNGNLIISDGVNQTTQNISSPVQVSNIKTKDIIWETSYPPYCYSYKINLTNGSSDKVDSNSLNFYLKLSAIDQQAKSVKLSAFIISDFNAIQMPISNTDKIKFEIITTTLDNSLDFMDVITCQYGPDDNAIPYDLRTSPEVFVVDGAYLNINYNSYPFTGITFCVKASIINSSDVLETFDATDITMIVPSFNTGNKLFVDVLEEVSNSITLDSSFNVTTIDWPSRDLRDSKIVWKHNRPELNLTFSYVDDAGEYIGPVNGPVIFSDKTWKVNLSGYGPNLATISLSSEKYLEVATLSTNPNLFDFLTLGKLKIGAISELDNLNLTRTVKLTAAIPYGDKLYNVPNNIPINWTWEYDNITDPEYTPIKLKQKNNNDYVYGIDMKSSMLSSIIVNVTPNYSKTSPEWHNVKIIANINTTTPPITGAYSFKVDDFPDPSIFNADFGIYYTNFKNSPEYKVDDTRYQSNTTITRSNHSVLNFTFSANNDIIGKISTKKINWGFNSIMNSISSDTYDISLTDPLTGLPESTINGLNLTAFKVNLIMSEAIAPGWTSAHNVSAVTNFYILCAEDFYPSLQFIIYPEYAWLGKIDPVTNQYDYRNVTFLDSDPTNPNYFTNCYMPSAYANKKSNSQTFWVSSNKTCFDEYIYQNKQNYAIRSTISAFDLIDIQYNPFDYKTKFGLPISLAAYNDTFYPPDIKLKYLDDLQDNYFIPISDRIASSTNSYLVTQHHTITAATTRRRPTTSIYDNFFISPILRDYSDVSLEYYPMTNGTFETVFNIENGGIISVAQLVNTIPPKQPAIISGGSITYCLSSKYWTVKTTIPAETIVMGTSAIYDLFEINQGDPSIPYFACESGKDKFVFYAEPTLKQKITSDTFDLYKYTNRYPSDTDLWEEIDI